LIVHFENNAKLEATFFSLIDLPETFIKASYLHIRSGTRSGFASL